MSPETLCIWGETIRSLRRELAWSDVPFPANLRKYAEAQLDAAARALAVNDDECVRFFENARDAVVEYRRAVEHVRALEATWVDETVSVQRVYMSNAENLAWRDANCPETSHAALLAGRVDHWVV